MNNMSITSVKKQIFMQKLTSYQVTFANDEIWSVPLDPDNRHYQAIIEWAEIDGNTIEEAD